MAEADPLERRAFRGGDDAAVELEPRETRVDELLREHEVSARGRDERVDEIGVDVERLVRRNRPGRGRPDHRHRRALGERREPERSGELRAIGVLDRKPDIDGDVGALLVFDLRFGERAAAVEAPVDGLQPAIDETLLEDAAERADLVGLGLERHRRVRMVPVAQHAEPLEVRLLPHDLLARIDPREPLRLLDRNVLAVALFDLHLDRHPVAIPAGHVRRVEARELLALDDDVLQDLVDGVADVDVVVRVRRAVVQHEARAPGRSRADRLVDVLLLPLLDPERLAPGEIAAHRKPRVGQVQRLLVVDFRVVGHRDCRFVRKRRRLRFRASLRTRSSRAPARRRLRSAGSARRDRRSAPRRAACGRIRRRSACRRWCRRSRR